VNLSNGDTFARLNSAHHQLYNPESAHSGQQNFGSQKALIAAASEKSCLQCLHCLEVAVTTLELVLGFGFRVQKKCSDPNWFLAHLGFVRVLVLRGQGLCFVEDTGLEFCFEVAF
jgi:hypothetical protein